MAQKQQKQQKQQKKTLWQKLRERLERKPDKAPDLDPDPDPTLSRRERFVSGVRGRVGGRYCTPPRLGVCTDCSGLVCEEFFAATGRTITCGSHEQFAQFISVPLGSLIPGDALYYKIEGGTRRGNDASHVGVYVGDGMAVHALNESQGIVTASMHGPYWAQRFLGARRLPFAGIATQPDKEKEITPPIARHDDFRKLPRLTQEQVCAILDETPMAGVCEAIWSASGGDPLPIAQAWPESNYGASENAQATKNPLGLLNRSGWTGRVYNADANGVRVQMLAFDAWQDAFAEWRWRMDDAAYKGGVYPQGATLAEFIRIYVAGPGPGYANGESAQSVESYLAQTEARINRYYALRPSDPGRLGQDAGSSALPVRVAIIPESNPNRPGTTITPSWITVHETGNQNIGAGAENHRYFTHELKGGPERVSFHYVVDDHEAIQLLPLDEMGWHAGDGCDDPVNDTGCFKSIAIETCVNQDGDWAQTKRNLVLLIQDILRRHPQMFRADRIAQHNRWSGKDCPQKIRAERSWDALLSAVKKGL